MRIAVWTTPVVVASLALALVLTGGAAAEPIVPPVQDLLGDDGSQSGDEDPGPLAAAEKFVDETLRPGEDDEGAPPGAGSGGEDGFADRLREAFGGPMWIAGLGSLAVALVGLGAFGLVTRYISPKEALKNPQRAMLYGFVKATPGAHLKQLSEEFNMKTSSILWHIRKLESADLVKSERANGFRVFYAVEGGIEVKRLSRAITALQNANARAIHEGVERRPGITVKELSERLDVHAGTVRWHLRKLREFGLAEELVRDDGSLFYPTPLGKKALQAAMGTPTTGTPVAKPVPAR